MPMTDTNPTKIPDEKEGPASLIKEQLKQHGRVGNLHETLIPSSDISLLHNESDSIVVIPDLEFSFAARELVDLSFFFTREQIKASRNLQTAVNKIKILVPVTVDEMNEEDVMPRPSILDSLEKKYDMEGDEGVTIPVESVMNEENPHTERLLEEFEREERMDAKLAQSSKEALRRRKAKLQSRIKKTAK